MVLSLEDPQTVARWPRSTTLAAGLARRGKIRLLLAAGRSPSEVAQAVGCNGPWSGSGPSDFSPRTWMAALTPPAAGPRAVCPPEVAIYVVRLACERPDSLGCSLSPWDGTDLARQLIAEGVVEGISAATVRRILAGHHLKPWRQHRWWYPKHPRAAVFYASISERIDLYTRLLHDDEVVLAVDENTS